MNRTAIETRAGTVAEGETLVTVGRISGLFGVRGWVKIHSHTDPKSNILAYSPWYLKTADGWVRKEIASGRPHGKGLVARLEGCDDRDQAARWIGAEIAVRRDQLPLPEEGEYYWADIEGLRVSTTEGVQLGVVDHLMATGANDVLVVRGERERLIPFIPGQVVVDVDLENGTMRVDWDPEF